MPALLATAAQPAVDTTSLLTQMGVSPEVAAAISAVIASVVTLLVTLKVIGKKSE